MLDSLLTAFQGPGSGFMYALTAVLAFGLAVLVERVWLLMLRWNVDEEAVLKALGSDLDSGLHALSGHPAQAMVKAGYLRAAPVDPLGVPYLLNPRDERVEMSKDSFLSALPSR